MTNLESLHRGLSWVFIRPPHNQEIKNMRDYLMIGPVPCEEECAQVGQDGYTKRALAECRRFMAQIERHYPIPDHCDAYLTIKRESHDFGDYYEVACVYDMADETASNWAFDVENDALGALRTWEVIENV